MAIQKYGTLTLEQLDTDSQRVDALSSNKYLKLEVGETVLRFLPSKRPDTSPLRITALHYLKNVPGSQQETLVFACPKQEFGIPCEVCARSLELGRSSLPQDRALASDFEPRLTIYANVVNRANMAGGPVIYSFGKQVFVGLKNIRRSQASGGNYTDPSANGFDISIVRTGTGRNDTKYTVTPARHNSPLVDTDAELDALMDAAHDLDKEVDAKVPELVVAYVKPRPTFPASQATVQRPLVGASFARPTIAPAPVVDTTAQPAATPSVNAADVIGYDDDFNPIYR